MLFYTGASRNAASILAQQRQASSEGQPRVIENLHGIKADALAVRDALGAGRLRLIGEILHESWQKKKRLVAGVSNEPIDRLDQLAVEPGGLGGNVGGAGGGGLL